MQIIKNIIQFLIYGLIWLPIIVFATQLPPVGNFSVPTSQQPGPFYSFGQNIIGKDVTQIYLMPSYLDLTSGHSLALASYYLYGITDDLSIMLNFLLALDYTQYQAQSEGLSNTLIQGEYAFYNQNSTDHSDTATVIAGLSLPTGSVHKNPPTGPGIGYLFLGLTYNRTWIEWMVFSSIGSFIPLKDSAYAGAQYLYQFGLGKNFLSESKKFIFLGLLELDGQYSEPGITHHVLNPNSGGNLIYLVPSLYYATEHLILQLGCALPIQQSWRGNQANYEYYVSGVIGWTF